MPLLVTTMLEGHWLRLRLGCRPWKHFHLGQGHDVPFTPPWQASLGLGT